MHSPRLVKERSASFRGFSGTPACTALWMAVLCKHSQRNSGTTELRAAGTGVAGRAGRTIRTSIGTRRAAESNAESGRCAGHDEGATGQGVGSAQATAKGARAGQGCRVRAFINSAGRQGGGSARIEDRDLEHNNLLRLLRHQRRQSEAVRSGVSGQRDRRFSG